MGDFPTYEGLLTEREGSCDACNRNVPLSELSTHMVQGCEGEFCDTCVGGGE